MRSVVWLGDGVVQVVEGVKNYCHHLASVLFTNKRDFAVNQQSRNFLNYIYIFLKISSIASYKDSAILKISGISLK